MPHLVIALKKPVRMNLNIISLDLPGAPEKSRSVSPLGSIGRFPINSSLIPIQPCQMRWQILSAAPVHQRRPAEPSGHGGYSAAT